MGVQVTIRPHKVRDPRGNEVEFDQYQILIGQRVMGYLGKLPECKPKLVVRDVPEEILRAIERACAEKLGQSDVAAVVSMPVGSDPANEPQPAAPEPNPADSAALEANLSQ